MRGWTVYSIDSTTARTAVLHGGILGYCSVEFKVVRGERPRNRPKRGRPFCIDEKSSTPHPSRAVIRLGWARLEGKQVQLHFATRYLISLGTPKQRPKQLRASVVLSKSTSIVSAHRYE